MVSPTGRKPMGPNIQNIPLRTELGKQLRDAFVKPPLPKGLCCTRLAEILMQSCLVHEKYACPDILLDRHEDGTIGIIVHDGGSSMITIHYCPWCGKKLHAPEGDHAGREDPSQAR